MRLISTIVALALAGCAGSPKHPTWSNATGAEQYERLMWTAIQRKDWKEIDRHLAPIFTGITSSGQALDRTGWTEYWQTQTVADYSLAEMNVVPEGQDMVVSYVLQSNGAVAGTRVLSVWQDVKGRWTLISTALVPIK